MKLEIVLWTAEWCGPCQSLKKSKVLEKAMVDLIASLPAIAPFGVPVECSIDVRDVDSKKWEQEAEDQNVQAMPTIDLIHSELGRVHRAVGALTQKQFVTRWVKALKK